VIVVLGRPCAAAAPGPRGESGEASMSPGGLAAAVALRLGRDGAAVELVGSVGDDVEGDAIVVALGRGRVGHAALLRDPSARTPRVGAEDVGPRPRLDAADIAMGLRYVPDCRVLVVAEDLTREAWSAALEAAEFHAAAVVALASAEARLPDDLPAGATVLLRPVAVVADATGPGDPAQGAGPTWLAADDAFAAVVADYALRLDRGEVPEGAFREALRHGAWEASAG
jgi:hypothetical protein